MATTSDMTRRAMWWGWAFTTLGLGVYGACAFEGDRREVLLPGRTTHGHHQIELSCETCHTEPFGEREAFQDACTGCHADELRDAHDSHPRSKFTNPRNAARVAQLDARECIACHVEHREDATGPMGLTLPGDYCFRCHEDIAEERPTHEGLGFETCASAGCHNFHDNRSLYEDYLVRHAGEPDLLPDAGVPARAFPPAGDAEHDPHADAEVACAACHGADSEDADGWSLEVDHTRCAECHEANVEEFLHGRHGMRLAVGLSPMTPALARLPMHADAQHTELGCATCHGAHEFDTRRASHDACVSCHDDEHTRAYEDSPHAETWRRELSGEAPPGSGVSCATCHMPRVESRGSVHVVHDQNANLRPNEAMIRTVCASCHGLPFSLDSLADPDLAESNFGGRPQRHVDSIEMAVGRRERR